MVALALGLMAALFWGTHDLLVRIISRGSDSMTALLLVLAMGLVLLLPVAAFMGGWEEATPWAMALAALSGVAYAIGGVGLYKAFAIGPVRLVAPITGSYPVLAVAIAAVTGRPVTLAQWLAIAAVVAGIALVAALSEDHAESSVTSGRNHAILWGLSGSIGFALTFALGQEATRQWAEVPVLVITRLAAMMALAVVLLMRRHRFHLHRPHLPLVLIMALLDVVAVGVVIASGTLADAEFATVASSLFGVVAILLAWRFLGEAVRPVQWFGLALAFAGIAYLATSAG